MRHYVATVAAVAAVTQPAPWGTVGLFVAAVLWASRLAAWFDRP